MQNVVEIKKRTKSAVLADTLVFVSVLAILITTLLSVVSTVTMFGGKITYGESMNIIEFFVGEEGFISYFANMLDGLESGSEEAILEVFGVFRVLVVLVSVILQLIFALINGIAIIVRFSKKDSTSE